MPIKLNWKTNRFAELRRKCPHIAIQIVEKHTDAAVSLMKQLAPVSKINAPGYVHMRDSIHAVEPPEGLEGLVAKRGIQIDKEYWFFVEYGTVHMSAQPFVTPAMESVRAGFVAECARIVKRELD